MAAIGPCTHSHPLNRSISDMGEVAVLVVDGTRLVSEAATRHRTAPTATAALGRALLGTLLLGSFRKEDEALQVTFRGDGPLGSMMTIADAKGNVRGKVRPPTASTHRGPLAHGGHVPAAPTSTTLTHQPAALPSFRLTPPTRTLLAPATCLLHPLPLRPQVDNPAADPPLREDGKLNVGAAVGAGVLAVVRSHPLEPRPYTGMVPIVSGEVAEDLANYLVRAGRHRRRRCTTFMT